MRKLLNKLSLCVLISVVGMSCSTEYDNYPVPSETLEGAVIDQGTGETVQTEIGSGGIRLRLDELSWSENPQPYYFYAMQDGTFRNTKIFEGEYRISAEGPFVPLLQNDEDGNITVDDRQTVQISGVEEIEFEVEPLLRLEWLSEPIVNADNTVSVEVMVTRGTDNPDYQMDISDVYLYVNSNPYVGNNNFDSRYSTQISPGNAVLGEPLTITTREGGLPGNRTYYIRVGARTDFGLRQYNYTVPAEVSIP